MKKINNMVLFFAAFLIFFSCATNRNLVREEGRFYEKSGGFSILLPEAWQVGEMPGLKYKVLIGQTENDFTQNIAFVDEAFGGDLTFYVNAAIGQLENLLGENFELTKRDDFVTLKNVKGEKLVTNTFQYNRHIRQIIYCFPGKGIKMLVTCSVSAESGETYDDFFDRIMETFEWTK